MGWIWREQGQSARYGSHVRNMTAPVLRCQTYELTSSPETQAKFDSADVAATRDPTKSSLVVKE